MNVQSQLQMDNATFLDWVQGREERYELAGGRVMMMTGATMRHGLIVGNLLELLRARLDRKQWVVLAEFGIDVRPGTIRYAGCGSLLASFLLRRRSGSNFNKQPPGLAAQRHNTALWLGVNARIQSCVCLLPTSLPHEKLP
jgi:hypothetical protein